MQICPGLGQFEHVNFLAGNPAEKLKIVGVAGTHGKTATSCLIAGVLSHAGNKVGLLGDLGYFDGENVEPPTYDSMPPDRLATLFARMVRHDCSHAVVEISDEALDFSQLSGVGFDAACVTNFARGECDSTRPKKDYRPAKSQMFDYLRGEAFVVLNADDPMSKNCLRRLDGPALTVGIENSAEVMGTPVEQFPGEQTFLVTAGSDTMPVRTRMIGTHHIYNCLTAAAVGLVYGVELPQIVRSLEAAQHMPGRLERIECGQPFSVYVDVAQTPDALLRCLRTLRSVVPGRLICVTADGETSKMIILDDLRDWFEKMDRAALIADRRAAVHQALSRAEKGDAVLIAGRGYETYRINDSDNDDDTPLDDREIAREWLHNMQPSM